ncbi:MAG: hypothetical protein NZ957_05945 [Thaumarchaeota archaeon]|nr:hypothetical protein [Candidatus Calditenuaceae archaeon]MDW8042061.1 hypothetical protein [Nitrososphaerota archaeon]
MKVREQLRRRRVETYPIELTENVPSAEVIQQLIGRYGLERVVRRRAPKELRESILKSTIAEAVRLLSETPEALERPILVGEHGAFFAWDEGMAKLHGLSLLSPRATRRNRTGR